MKTGVEHLGRAKISTLFRCLLLCFLVGVSGCFGSPLTCTGHGEMDPEMRIQAYENCLVLEGEDCYEKWLEQPAAVQ